MVVSASPAASAIPLTKGGLGVVASSPSAKSSSHQAANGSPGQQGGIINHQITDHTPSSQAWIPFQVSSLYDEMDRLTNVSCVGAGSSCVGASYAFTSVGFLTNKLYSNGVAAQYAYDAVWRMAGLTNQSQSVILAAYQYEYDKAQMITGIVRNTKAVRMAGIFSHKGAKARSES